MLCSGELVRGGGCDLAHATPPVGAKVLARFVGRDGDQPRPEALGLADAGQSLPRLDPRQLGGIARRVDVAGDGIGDAHELGMMPLDERGEGLALAGPRPSEQLGRRSRRDPFVGLHVSRCRSSPERPTAHLDDRRRGPTANGAFARVVLHGGMGQAEAVGGGLQAIRGP